MLLLHVLVFSCYIAYTHTLAIITQPYLSITKPGSGRSTVRIKCQGTGGSSYIHWYSQKSKGEIKRILYIQDGRVNYDDGVDQTQFNAVKQADSNDLTIQSITAEEAATYYCAVWDWDDISFIKVFGSGTKLVVTSKKVKEPDTKILSPSVEDIEKKGKGVYLCLLENFFPDVIKVEWYKEGNNNVLASQQDEIKLDNKTQLYSTRSWITVLKSDLGKKFTCKFKHEGVTASEHWKEVSIVKKRNQPIVKETTEKTVIENKTCDNNATGVVYLNQRSYRAASLTYTLLLVKSTMYSLMLLLFMFSSRHWLGVSKRMNVE